MVYTSIPAYIDPANWQQQQPNHQQGNTGALASQILHPPPPLPPSTQSHGAGSTGSIRPGSMADRARMANIPMQEPAQRCPRCDSTNTKFCYFNNYSLSQPRHFCKTCRRYWTRGGALRSVPVGGGCRRNKRSKGTTTSSTSSKSPASSDRQTTSAGGGPTNSASSSGGGSAADMVGLSPMVPPSLRFMAPLHHHQLGDHFSGGGGTGGNIGLNYGLSYSAISNPMGGIGDLNFHIGSGINNGSVLSSSAGLEQWRVPQTQQFPFLAGLEASSSPHGLFPFESSTNEAAPGYGGSGGGVGFRPKVSASGVIAQLASVKMEENNTHQELNLSRQFLGITTNSSDYQPYWTPVTTSSSWNDLNGFSSSSTAMNPQ